MLDYSDRNKYMQEGYYNADTYLNYVQNPAAATKISVAGGDISNINLTIMPYRTISGVISLPDGMSAPAGGYEVTLLVKSVASTAAGIKLFVSEIPVVIPEGQGLVEYSCRIPVGLPEGYLIGYRSSNGRGYYNPDKPNCIVASEKDAQPAIVDDTNVENVNLSLVNDFTSTDVEVKVNLQREEPNSEGKAVYTFITEICGETEEAVTGFTAEFNVIDTKDGKTQYLDFYNVTPLGVQEPNDVNEPYKFMYAASIKLPPGNNYTFEAAFSKDDNTIFVKKKFDVNSIWDIDAAIAVVESKLTGNQISLSWKPYPGTNNYEVYISPDYNLPGGTLAVTTQENSCTITTDGSRNFWYVYVVACDDFRRIVLSPVIIAGEVSIKGIIKLPDTVSPVVAPVYVFITLETDSETDILRTEQIVTIPVGSKVTEFNLSIPKDTTYKWRLIYFFPGDHQGYTAVGNYDHSTRTTRSFKVPGTICTEESITDIVVEVIKTKGFFFGEVLLPGNNKATRKYNVLVFAIYLPKPWEEPLQVLFPSTVSTILPGFTRGVYTSIFVPYDIDGEYALGYIMLDDDQSEFLPIGFYNKNTYLDYVQNLDDATRLTIDGTGSSHYVNLTLMPCKTISGVISLSNDMVAPTGGYEVTQIIKSVALTDNGANVFISEIPLVIPEGQNSVQYSCAVPDGLPGGYIVGFRSSRGSGYYNPNMPNSIVSSEEEAEPVTVDGANAENINLLLIPPSFDAGEIKVTDMEGNQITTLSCNSAIKASVTVSNCSQESQNATLIIGLYNINNSMLCYQAKDKLIEGDSSAKIEVELTLPENVDGCKLKAFLWDGLDSMIPLTLPSIVP